MLCLRSPGGAQAEVVVPADAEAGRPGSSGASPEPGIDEGAALGGLQVGELDPVPADPRQSIRPGDGRRRRRGPGGGAVGGFVFGGVRGRGRGLVGSGAGDGSAEFSDFERTCSPASGSPPQADATSATRSSGATRARGTK